MDDWAFGTTDLRDKRKSLHILKGHTCDLCVHRNIKSKKGNWCYKKTDEPPEGVCEWWSDEMTNERGITYSVIS